MWHKQYDKYTKFWFTQKLQVGPKFHKQLQRNSKWHRIKQNIFKGEKLKYNFFVQHTPIIFVLFTT